MNQILLQIDACRNYGSTGRINEQIGLLAEQNGWTSYIAHGSRYVNPSQLKSIQVVSTLEEYWHALESKIFDNHGLSSRIATKRFVKKVKKIRPTLIHLHTIHGYYLNYKILFEYLAEANIPVVWTLHDCWNFTGHCGYFSALGCFRWQSMCNNCPGIKKYPSSILFDRSMKNFEMKKKYFTSVQNLTLVPVSNWLAELVNHSFFKNCSNVKVRTIHNGVDINLFQPELINTINSRKKIGVAENDFMAIACATTWTVSKGLNDYIELSKLISDKTKLVLVGVSDEIKTQLPKNIIALSRTDNVQELASLYSAADVVLNLSYEETFGLTTVEGMACGTPTIVYNATASPELVTDEVGFIVETGDIEGVKKSMEIIATKDKTEYSLACRNRAVTMYDKNRKYQEYIDLYESLI